MERRDEKLTFGLLLALAGGMLDAYTYLCRGEVFATAETGNLVLLGLNLAAGDFRRAALYLLPVLAFAGGVWAAEGLSLLPERGLLRVRQWILLLECAVLVVVAHLPRAADAAANMLISFLSAVQMQSFRRFRGLVCATTMCTGNLRSGMEKLFRHVTGRGEPGAWVYFLLISTFVAGAILSGALSRFWGSRTVLAACLPLLLAFSTLFEKQERIDRI